MKSTIQTQLLADIKRTGAKVAGLQALSSRGIFADQPLTLDDLDAITLLATDVNQDLKQLAALAAQLKTPQA